jgi:hypothetical protein
LNEERRYLDCKGSERYSTVKGEVVDFLTSNRSLALEQSFVTKWHIECADRAEALRLIGGRLSANCYEFFKVIRG